MQLWVRVVIRAGKRVFRRLRSRRAKGVIEDVCKPDMKQECISPAKEALAIA
ncbi:hypothetical protein GCM10022213_17110 [Parerythrobacter jejuensis]